MTQTFLIQKYQQKGELLQMTATIQPVSFYIEEKMQTMKIDAQQLAKSLHLSLVQVEAILSNQVIIDNQLDARLAASLNEPTGYFIKKQKQLMK